MIKIFWSQPMALWASTVLYRHDEKFAVLPTTDAKLGTNGRWVGNRTGAGVTATLQV